MKNRMPYRVELPPVSASRPDDLPSLWVVVLSASRIGLPASDRFDPRYLTQSLTALMQLSDDYAFSARGEKRFQ